MSKKGSSLGKSLVRDHKKKRVHVNKEGFRHNCDLNDGRDWACLNLRSVTEQSSLDEFLDKVQLADNEYNKEFMNISIVSKEEAVGLLTEEQKLAIAQQHKENEHFLTIPRRPSWDINTTKEVLDAQERQSFLSWRKNLALMKEEKKLNITPYETNLEVWRQLWRVIEKSDVIVQILDARNPLLFRCEDLEVYVKEINEKKSNVLLLNKADLLSFEQRQMWANYFDTIGVKVVFFSALEAAQKGSSDDSDIPLEDLEAREDEEDYDDEESGEDESEEEDNEIQEASENLVDDSSNAKNTSIIVPEDDDTGKRKEGNNPKLLSNSDLVSFLKAHAKDVRQDSEIATIGLVGYPNVGKSSTINAVLMYKKVQVSATPGKTKHFQTIILENDFCFCDCPGLVFPKFIATKADMVISGILPIDQLTDHMAPMALITNLIPRNVLESTYSVMIPPPAEGKDPTSPPTAEEFLNAYGYLRGFMTQRGIPDTARSSRYILKDFINGKLLHCHAPPSINKEDYEKFIIRTVPDQPKKIFNPSSKGSKSFAKSDEIDRNFFQKKKSQAHFKSISGYDKIRATASSSDSNIDPKSKPWRKHNNRNKREKLRRVYSSSDY